MTKLQAVKEMLVDAIKHDKKIGYKSQWTELLETELKRMKKRKKS